MMFTKYTIIYTVLQYYVFFFTSKNFMFCDKVHNDKRMVTVKRTPDMLLARALKIKIKLKHKSIPK